MKKPVFLSLLLILLSQFLIAQDWSWATGVSSNNVDGIYATALDDDGNVYAVGDIADTVVLGSITLTSQGGSDMFIAKYNANGSVIWARSAGGVSADGARGVDVDANGNVFVSGAFEGDSIVFDVTTLMNTSTGGSMYLVKYDSSGMLLWAKGSDGGANGYIKPQDLVVDFNGDILVCGSFDNDSITFDGVTIYDSDVISTFEDPFVFKFSNATGTAMWGNTALISTTFADQIAQSVDTDPNGNVYVTGHFQTDTIIIGTDTLVNSNVGSYDMYLAKYDANGNPLWARAAGGNQADESNSVAVNSAGEAYISGNFQSDSIIFGGTAHYATGRAIITVKFDSLGNVLWSHSFGGTSFDVCNANTLDENENLYIGGYFSSATLQVDTSTHSNTGLNDIIIVQYDPSGKVLWDEAIGGVSGSSDDRVWAVSVGGGDVYFAGTFSSDTLTFDAYSILNNGGWDGWLAKLSSCIPVANFTSLVIQSTVSFSDISTGNPTSWLWEFGDGDSSNLKDPMHTYSTATTYTVCLTVTNACGKDDACSTVVISGISDIGNQDLIHVYPNPASDELILDIGTESRTFGFSLRNLQGQEVLSGQVQKGVQRIGLEQLPKGLYFLNIQDQNNNSIHKVLIQ